ncbi:FxsA family protein [Frigidibacter sp.]|uniref:FxsA family protein n=1 Tax=Frigidibacter sp. TaxID=2586418 RepID=UPI002733C699|nr:FxsA family protein [Frigidibacter sp.]MDP3339151.1 FxsA family protein [Frigidibacter sp.]
MWLFVAFLAVPLIEITLFIQVGGLIGLWPTLALVLLTAVAGTWLMRREGARALNDLRRSLNEVRDPTGDIAHGAMILLAGALLLTPGFFTDTLGILLLIKPVRTWLMAQVGKRVTMTRFTVGDAPMDGRHPGHRPDPHRGPTVIDAEFHEVEDSTPPRGPSGWTRD